MIYLVAGSDRPRITTQYEKIKSACLAKRPDSLVLSRDVESFRAEEVAELAGSATLFGSKYVIGIRYVLSEGSTETAAALRQLLPACQASAHVWIFLENDISQEDLELFREYAHKVEVFEAKKVEKTFDTSIFKLTDAFALRDRRTAWVLFHSAVRKGTAPEEIFWKLVWQVKVLLRAEASASPAEAEMKPFVYGKAKEALGQHAERPVRELSRELLELYHQVRLGRRDMALGVEQMILGL